MATRKKKDGTVVEVSPKYDTLREEFNIIVKLSSKKPAHKVIYAWLKEKADDGFNISELIRQMLYEKATGQFTPPQVQVTQSNQPMVSESDERNKLLLAGLDAVDDLDE